MNTATPLNSTIVNESLPRSVRLEEPAAEVIVNASPDKATVTSGTTLPSGKTYRPTKSDGGGLGAGSDWAYTLIINIEDRMDKIIFFITGVFNFKRKLGFIF